MSEINIKSFFCAAIPPSLNFKQPLFQVIIHLVNPVLGDFELFGYGKKLLWGYFYCGHGVPHIICWLLNEYLLPNFIGIRTRFDNKMKLYYSKLPNE
ncbi:hypothetical protein D1872_250520 [compost metagenome]